MGQDTEKLMLMVDRVATGADESIAIMDLLARLHKMYEINDASFRSVVTSAISHEAFNYRASVDNGVIQLNKYSLSIRVRDFAKAGVDAQAVEVYASVRRLVAKDLKKTFLKKKQVEEVLMAFLEGVIE